MNELNKIIEEAINDSYDFCIHQGNSYSIDNFLQYLNDHGYKVVDNNDTPCYNKDNKGNEND